MKNIQILILLLTGVLCFNSCELDNYPGPTGSLSGALIDSETGEMVQGDIISGTQIELIEQGYENPPIQRLIVQVDGSYRNDMLFEGMYTLLPLTRGNFVPQTDTIPLEIGSGTIHNFEVLPYIRIKDANITIDGTKITATFKLEQTVENKVKSMGLWGHSSAAVGEPLQFGKKTKTLNTVVDPEEEYELVLDVRTDKDFVKGEAYYFRIGAIIDADEAEYNYAPAVRLTIPVSEED
jgi:hypothetical protein